MYSKRKDNKVKMKCKKTQSDRNCRNSFINSLAKRFLSKVTSFIITQGVVYSRSLRAAKILTIHSYHCQDYIKEGRLSGKLFCHAL